MVLSSLVLLVGVYCLQLWLWQSSLCLLEKSLNKYLEVSLLLWSTEEGFVKGHLIKGMPVYLSNIALVLVLLKLFPFLCFLWRWLTWGCYFTLAPTSVTCGISWTSLWSVGPWWHLPSRKYIFLNIPISTKYVAEEARPWHRAGWRVAFVAPFVSEMFSFCPLSSRSWEEEIKNPYTFVVESLENSPSFRVSPFTVHSNTKSRVLWTFGQLLFKDAL